MGAAGCGDSAATQCAKLFDHMLKIKGTKLDSSSAKYKSRKAEFKTKCGKTFNAKTRSCMLGSKDQSSAIKCLRHMDKGKASVGAFNKYISKSKTTEARIFVKKIYDGARAYYMGDHATRGSIGRLPPQFPTPSQGPTPPLGSCCKAGGKCGPNASHWTSPVWAALQFSVSDPHYFSYSYIVKGNTFTARANGDLDCDGEYSTFEMIGIIDETTRDAPPGNARLHREKELE